MIISIEAQKTSDKISYLFLIKTLGIFRVYRNFFKLIKTLQLTSYLMVKD